MPIWQVNNNIYIFFSNITQTPTFTLPSCLKIPAFCITAKSFSPFLMSPTWLPTSLRHLLSVTNSPQNDNILVFNHFSFRHITDMSPTFTSALPPLLPTHYRQNNICTDIYTDNIASTFSVHRPAIN